MIEASTPTDWFLSFSHLIYSQVQLKNTKLSRATWCWPSDLIFPPPSPNDDRTNHDWRLYVLSRYCAPYHHCMHIRSGSQIVYFIFYFWQSFYFLSGESHVCTHTSSRLYRMFLYYSSLSLSFFLSFFYLCQFELMSWKTANSANGAKGNSINSSCRDLRGKKRFNPIQQKLIEIERNEVSRDVSNCVGRLLQRDSFAWWHFHFHRKNLVRTKKKPFVQFVTVEARSNSCAVFYLQTSYRKVPVDRF